MLDINLLYCQPKKTNLKFNMIIKIDSEEGLESSSPLAIEDLLYQEMNWFFILTNPTLREDHRIFNCVNQTSSSFFIMCIVLTTFSIPMLVLLATNWVYCHTIYEYTCWMVFGISLPVINLFCWQVYYKERKIIHCHHGRIPLSSSQLIERVQAMMLFALHLLLCFRLISKVIAGPGHNNHNNYSKSFNYNPLGELHAIPTDTSIVIMMLPILYSTITRGAHVRFSFLLWAMTMVSLVFSVLYIDARMSILNVIFYIIFSFVILRESARINVFLYFTNKRLKEILQRKEKAAEEASAIEMRHMIANVAHDLKTPLCSFLCGTEYISHVIGEVVKKRDMLSMVDVDDFVQSISHCVTNMRNTNSFMLMTINRCIDYTKASKGVKLVPKFETMDLMETLSLPLNCMKDIQQRVSIVLEAVSKEICSHIITDKQWLQENVLCLLSNAVKYSNEGEVRVRVTMKAAEDYSRGGGVMQALISRVSELRPSSVASHSTLHSFRFGNSRSILPCETLDKPDLNGPNVTNEYLIVEVEDHGIGLSEDAMGNLFTPFKQAQRLAGGTGLGLFSLAKRIEALDGKCGVERRRDGLEGSLFWFMIPYRADEQAAELSQTREISYRAEQFNNIQQLSSVAMIDRNLQPLNAYEKPGKIVINSDIQSLADCVTPCVDHLFHFDSSNTDSANKSEVTPREDRSMPKLDILLVDDSPAILKMTSMMLKRHKHRVSTAVNGAEAVKMVIERVDREGRGFDVILMDLQMPVMDGLEATRRIKNLGSISSGTLLSKTSPSLLADGQLVHHNNLNLGVSMLQHFIIGVSANSDMDTANEAYQCGMDAFIFKPFSLDKFYQTYENVLSRKEHE